MDITGQYEMEYLGEVVKQNKAGEEYRQHKFMDKANFDSVTLRPDDAVISKMKLLKKGDSVTLSIRTQENNGKTYRSIIAIKGGSEAVR